MDSNKLTILLLATICCISVSAVSKIATNQIWWSQKRFPQTAQTGCNAMCCDGRNSSCSSTGLRMGGKVSASGRCFCDEGCLDMEDCCEDYSVECQAVDCIVGDWQDYGPCSKACGLGVKSRSREVIQEPRNGGQKCPVLTERTVCTGRRCKSQRHLGARGRSDQGLARIMPAAYGQFRNFKEYNAHMDIRKNLFQRYYARAVADRRGYCAMFEITSTRANCANPSTPNWANSLVKGASLCVECQTKAMDGSSGVTCAGHGEMTKDTYWTAVNALGCHGWWRRTTELSECSCNGQNGLDFIFV